ncbi:MAG: hypothetical protein DMG65_13000 [Candidatus Angelobacter sp. Gp1-AA117]|nr:MAG: hypothetical protein DMG65_13000 [Candidatus Angelobacter sp. Gp1-AA117]
MSAGSLPVIKDKTANIASRPNIDASAVPKAKPRNWRVIHACEYAHDVLTVVEGQVTAGMRPYIVTPYGAGSAELYRAQKNLEQPHSLSLLRAWQDVRNWRKSLLECDPESSADVVHAHSFASGMAGVRNLSCVVYDSTSCIEELAISAGQCEKGSWMARSFRVAEQFILSRAEALIVHSSGMKAAVEERGAQPESIFLIPQPVDLESESPLFENSFLQERFAISADTICYFLPDIASTEKDMVPDSVISVLESFAFVAKELQNCALLVAASRAGAESVRGHAGRLDISAKVFMVEEADAAAALQGADVVIATAELPADLVLARHSNDVCVNSLRMGKPLLAADVARNRDCSPDGRGCLWFKEGDVKDLGYRMAFLGRNPDFRSALASSGRTYVFETRSPAAIGYLYDDVYRYALSRKKSNGSNQNNATSLQPATSAGW